LVVRRQWSVLEGGYGNVVIPIMTIRHPSKRAPYFKDATAVLVFGSESAEDINQETDQENQANAAAANGRAAKIKSATTEQEQENHQYE